MSKTFRCTAPHTATMITREFVVSDQPRVNRLQDEFMSEFFPEYVTDPRQFDCNADVYDINEYYLNRGGKIWVVEVDDCVAGFGGFRLVESTTAEIKRLRITARQRGKGIGKSIMYKIEKYCNASGISKILVGTDDRLTAANAMYQNLGYNLYDTDVDTKNGIVYKDNFYQKILGNECNRHA